MGIDTRAVIVVGYTYDEIHEVYQKCEDAVDFNYWSEDNKLEMISPYYDANSEDCLFGVSIQSTRDYDYATLNIDDQEIEDISQKYFSKFGKYPKTFLSPYVW